MLANSPVVKAGLDKITEKVVDIAKGGLPFRKGVNAELARLGAENNALAVRVDVLETAVKALVGEKVSKSKPAADAVAGGE